MSKDDDMAMETTATQRPKRYSISVTAPIYEQLLEMSEESTSLQRFVDGLIVGALDDPKIAARVLGKCRSAEAR